MEGDGGIGCGRSMGTGRGGGRGRGRKGSSQAAGPDGNCVCPSCRYKVKHKAGQPCYEQKCLALQTKLSRCRITPPLKN